MSFIWRPIGQFTIGTSLESADARVDNTTKCKVSIDRGFWIATNEVSTRNAAVLLPDLRPILLQGESYRKQGVEGPGISWFDAIRFCRALTAREQALGLPSSFAYNLPTEAQWEYSSGNGNETDFEDHHHAGL